MIDLMIHNAILVTMADDGLGIVNDGAIGINDDRIVCVGDSSQIKVEFSAKRYMDGAGKIVMPGLINAHTHSYGILNRGVLAEIESYLEEGMVGYMGDWKPESLMAAMKLHFLEGIRHGTTTFCDHTIMLGKTAHVYEDIGVRARISPMVRELQWDIADYLGGDYVFDRSYAEEAINDTLFLLEKYGANPHEKVSTIVGFQALDYVTKELVIELRELAHKYSAMIATHVAQSPHEVDQCIRRFGARPVEVLENLGLLNGNTVAAHMTLNTDDENAKAAKAGLKMAFCPMVWGQTGDSPPAVEYSGHGGTVGLGTDEASFSGVNMFTDMKVGCITATTRAKYAGKPPLVAWEVLRMATIGSAKAIGMDALVGSLEPGKKADVIVLDAQRPNMYPILLEPLRNIAQNLVYATTGDEVETVIIDGQVVMEDGKVLTMDEQEVLAESQKWADMMSETAHNYFKSLKVSDVLAYQTNY